MRMRLLFLLESSRLFPLLSSSDLIAVASSHSSLLEIIKQPFFWKAIFERESAEQLAKATRVSWVRRIYQLLYPRVPNPRLFGWQYDDAVAVDSPSEEGVPLGKSGPRICVSYLERLDGEKTVVLDALTLIDELPNGEGWYEDGDGFCHFIRLYNDVNESGIVLYCGIPRLQWDRLTSLVDLVMSC